MHIRIFHILEKNMKHMLKNVENDHIHNWYNYCKKEQYNNINYPEPMINYEKSRTNCLKIFKDSLY